VLLSNELAIKFVPSSLLATDVPPLQTSAPPVLTRISISVILVCVRPKFPRWNILHLVEEGI
jgi:hypothetical protein